MTSLAGPPSSDERRRDGRSRRGPTPLGAHALVDTAADRDPVGLLQAECADRVPELVPLRYSRMLRSPFAFYRGAAGVMAADLARTPVSGLHAQLCGDAHLANFGGFASPERALVFDVNDFDETLPGPFEWDVKRLAASFELVGRERGFADSVRTQIVREVARVYRQGMRRFAESSNLAVWYARLDASSLLEELRGLDGGRAHAQLKKTAAKARRRDSLRALAKLTTTVDGDPRIISDPPLLVPLSELLGATIGAVRLEDGLKRLLESYRSSLPDDRRRLFDGYRYVDLARKVVGVGSVGTRCWVVLLLGRDEQDPLFLQVKEASASVLEPFVAPSGHPNHGQRVVEGQRLVQAASDIFLGWVTGPVEVDGRARDFYVRQLLDWKTSLRLDTVSAEGLALYARACGWTLARGHARSGDRIAIGGYLGKSDTFDRAIATFAASYADVAERDHAALVEAAAQGRVPTDAAGV
jgi:uncharacterized protein (DUF2252 family)